MTNWVPRCNRALGLAIGVVVALAVQDASVLAEDSKGPAEPRYQVRVVRIEHASMAMLYRLDRDSGEVCAFGIPERGVGESRGCMGATSSDFPNRFALDAVQGARGTNQSSAYRLDRVTGEICRFRLPAAPEATLEKVGCVGARAERGKPES